jgi:hypothetical protein
MASTCHGHLDESRRDDADGFPGSGAIVRPALAAALSFMEMTSGDDCGVAELAGWMKHRLVEPGLMPMAETVHEKGIGSVSLSQAGPDSRAPSSGEPWDPAGRTHEAWSAPIEARLTRIVAAARARVAETLRALVAQPGDDRFLAAAIFAGRVQRATTLRGSEWVPSPGVSDRLSDVVLALFAADILAHREDYERGIRVCETCGRMCFGPAAVVEACCGAR